MGIDARNLLRHVGPHAQSAPRKQIHKLEGLESERLAGAGQERFDMLDQRGNHELVTVAACRVQQLAPGIFNGTRFGRKHVGDMVGKYPGRHG